MARASHRAFGCTRCLPQSLVRSLLTTIINLPILQSKTAIQSSFQQRLSPQNRHDLTNFQR